MISTQRATGSLLGEIRSRTPSWSTSAAVPGVEPRPASRSRSNTSRGGSPETSHMCATSIGEYACRWMSGATLLGVAAASPRSPRAPSRDGCPTACRSRSRRTRPPRATRRANSSRVVLVGVRRAPPCPKPQNAQPTMHTLETLMLRLTTNVTVSPASSARSSSAACAHVLDRLGARLGEQRRQLVRGQRSAVAAARDRAGRRGRARIAALDAPARAAARDEAPVPRLDRRRARPARATRGRCTAGRRTAARSARRLRLPAACAPGAATGTGARARCGRRWRSARRGRSRPPRPARATSPRGSAASACRRRASAARASRPGASCRRSCTGVAQPARRGAGVAAAPCASTRSAAASAISAGSSP